MNDFFILKVSAKLETGFLSVKRTKVSWNINLLLITDCTVSSPFK